MQNNPIDKYTRTYISPDESTGYGIYKNGDKEVVSRLYPDPGKGKQKFGCKGSNFMNTSKMPLFETIKVEYDLFNKRPFLRQIIDSKIIVCRIKLKKIVSKTIVFDTITDLLLFNLVLIQRLACHNPNLVIRLL